MDIVRYNTSEYPSTKWRSFAYELSKIRLDKNKDRLGSVV